MLSELDVLVFGCGLGSFIGVCIGIGIVQGLVLGVELLMIGVFMLVIMVQGVWCKIGVICVLVVIDVCMGEVYWVEYQCDEQGVWYGEEMEVVFKLDVVVE